MSPTCNPASAIQTVLLTTANDLPSAAMQPAALPAPETPGNIVFLCSLLYPLKE